jgi:dipeptide/tripeptide permease
MENGMETTSKMKLSPLMITILAVWFVANLLSQVLYISINGNPYDGVAMLASLGTYYYLILAIEVFLWLWFLCYLSVKAIKQITRNRLKEEIGNIGDLTKSMSIA